MDENRLLKVWKSFTESNDFKLNPDKEHVGMVAKGVLLNEDKFKLKLCPCRIRDGTLDRDLKLTCSCNFKIQECWEKQGMCWCGLFVRK